MPGESAESRNLHLIAPRLMDDRKGKRWGQNDIIVILAIGNICGVIPYLWYSHIGLCRSVSMTSEVMAAPASVFVSEKIDFSLLCGLHATLVAAVNFCVFETTKVGFTRISAS